MRLRSDTLSHDAIARYAVRVVPEGRVCVAAALLRYWDAPWSSSAKRFAYHALRTAYSRGLDVLEP